MQRLWCRSGVVRSSCLRSECSAEGDNFISLTPAAGPAASCRGLACRFGLRAAVPPKLSLCDSAAVAAELACVPHGQWALFDADILVMIDRSACLVEPLCRGARSESLCSFKLLRSRRSSPHVVSRSCSFPLFCSCGPHVRLIFSTPVPSCSCRLTATVARWI